MKRNLPNQLTDIQNEVLIGNLLGDGCLSYLKTNKCNSCFSIGQKTANKEYVDVLNNIYLPFSSNVYETKSRKPGHDLNGKISRNLEYWNGEYCYYTAFSTVKHPIFTEHRFKWYTDPYQKKSQKIVPQDIFLTWRVIAFWMCDDGSNNPGRQRRSTFYTDGLLESDVEFLKLKLKQDLNIESKIYLRNGKPIIIINGDNWFRVIEKIKPFITWECFQYKCINREKTDRHKVLFKSNISGSIGVCYNEARKRKSKWRAYIYVNKQNILLGWFETKEEAVNIRKKAENLCESGITEKEEYLKLKEK